MSWRPKICCLRVPSRRVSMEEVLETRLWWLLAGLVWSGVGTRSGQVSATGWIGLVSKKDVCVGRGLGDGVGVLIWISGGGGNSETFDSRWVCWMGGGNSGKTV